MLTLYISNNGETLHKPIACTKGVTIEVLPSGDCLALQDIYNITNGLL
jgi:hypothetical protein